MNERNLEFLFQSKNKKYICNYITDNEANTANQIKQLTKQNKKYKRKIKSLTKVLFEEEKNAKYNDADSNVNTSDQFGGKASKRAKQKV